MSLPREPFHEPRRAPAPLASLLLTLATSLYLLLLLVAWHRRGGMTEREEWLVYVEGWALVPALSLGSTAVLQRLVARAGAEGLWRLACASVGVLVLGAIALRGAGGSVLRATAIEIAIAATYLPVLLVVARMRPSTRDARSDLWPIGTTAMWAALIAVLTLPMPPELPSLGVIALVALVSLITLRSGSPNGPGRSWIVDGLVLTTLPAVIFEPQLPFDVHHHDWFLGPVNAVMHGWTILVDAFTPYGVLPIELLAGVFALNLVPMSYVGLALLLTILVLVQYVGVYVLLRCLCRSTAVAVTGLAVALVVNVAPTDLTKYPSAGPLRFGLPWLLPLLAIARARRPSNRRATYAAEALVVGIAATWDVQTLLATLAAWGGILLAEVAFAARDATRWLRLASGRVAGAAAAVVAAHAILAACVVATSGEWPQWATFFALIRSFSPEGEGWSLFLAPAWGGWIALVIVYLASLFASIYALPLARTRGAAVGLVVAFSVTLMGIAQLSYYVGLSVFTRLYYVTLPACVVGAFWADRLLARDWAGSRGWSRAGAACMLLGATLWAGHFEAAVGTRLQSSAIGITAGAVVGRAIPAPEGCPSLRACLVGTYPVQPATGDALALIARHAPGDGPLGVFLSTRATTETLVLSRRAHVFPLMDASHDGLSAMNMDRIAAAPHGLQVGDAIFVDRLRMTHVRIPTSRVQDGDPFLARLLDRVCNEFRCVPEERRGAVTVMRLARRG